MKIKAFALATLLLAGCGSSADTTVASAPGATASVNAAQGATLSSAGHTLTLAPGSLTQSATVQLDVLATPPAQPPETDFRSVGTFSQLSFGGAHLDPSRPSTYTVPYKGGQGTVVLLVDGEFIPLDTHADGGTLTASLDVDPVALDALDPAHEGIEVGVVEEVSSARPYVPWTSYNLYHYTGGKFVPIVNQGVPAGPLPDLGSRPLLVVHGLGSNIRGQGFGKLAQQLLQSGACTGIVGFEYDSLAAIPANGTKLRQALGQLTQDNPGRAWRIAGHSMGTLVTRNAVEGVALPFLPATGNRAVLAAGPLVGTPVIQKLQGDLNAAQRGIRYVVLNNVLEFTNANFERCEVKITDPSWNDLAQDSPFIRAQNEGAAGKHPQFDYHTLGGNSPGFQFLVLNSLFSIYPEDGLVFLASANAPVVGQIRTATVPTNHNTIYTEASGINQIVEFEQ